MNRLDQFLARVARELRSMPDWKREEELRELRLHLEQRVEDFEAQELKPEEAQARAVEAFGSPRRLGAELCDAWEGVPTSWRGIAAAVLKTITIWLTVQVVLLMPLVVLPQVSYPLSPTILTFVSVFIVFFFLSTLGLSVYCGILLSLQLGRRGPIVVLAIPFVAALLSDGFLAVEHYVPVDNYIPTEGIVYQQVVVLCLSMLYTLPLWLLGAVICRIIRVRRLRSLPPGETPNAKGEDGSFARFKPRKR
jgi:hypothetical protein